MPLPALVLAPIAAFIGGIATKLLDGVITLFTKKFLIHAALIILFGIIYTTFITAMNVLVNSINIGSLPQILIDGFSVLPSNTDDCIAIIIAAKLIVLAFNIQREVLDIRKA